MASLHQNRKHYETGLFTPTRARSTAQSTLAPFSHPHILWSGLCLLLDRYVHRDAAIKSNQCLQSPHNPSLFDLKREVNLLIVLRDYSSGLLLWVTGHMRDMGCTKALTTKNRATSEEPTEIQYDYNHKLVSFTAKKNWLLCVLQPVWQNNAFIHLNEMAQQGCSHRGLQQRAQGSRPKKVDPSYLQHTPNSIKQQGQVSFEVLIRAVGYYYLHYLFHWLIVWSKLV